MPRELPPGDAYRILESREAGVEDLHTRPTGVTATEGPILYGLDAARRRHLLVPVKPGQKNQEDRLSAGVQIHDTSLIDDGIERGFVDVVCLLPHLNTIFEVLVDEMLDAVERTDNPGRVVIQVLERWRELLERARSGLLSRQRLAGVVGELLVLRALSDPVPVDIDWWTGPLGHVHDIVWPGHSLEIKTTLSREHSRIEINGIEQLADTAGRSLHLVFIRLIQDAAGDLTAPQLVDDLAARGLDRFELHRRCSAVGLSPHDTEAYKRIPFQLLDMSVYRVDEQFPRLTTDTLKEPVPPGLSDISYVLDLKALQVQAAQVDEATDLMKIVTS